MSSFDWFLDDFFTFSNFSSDFSVINISNSTKDFYDDIANRISHRLSPTVKVKVESSYYDCVCPNITQGTVTKTSNSETIQQTTHHPTKSIWNKAQSKEDGIMKTTNHENNFVEEISIEEISSSDEYDEDSDNILRNSRESQQSGFNLIRQSDGKNLTFHWLQYHLDLFIISRVLLTRSPL